MLLRLRASDLIDALDIMSIVPPKGLTPQQNSAAYLFKCGTNAAGAATCWVYSRGSDEVARAEFPLVELEGEGSFTMPANHVGMWCQVPADEITFEALAPDGQGFTVIGRSTTGMKHEHATYDPRLIASCDHEFAIAKANGEKSYLPGILREALSEAKVFLPEGSRKDVVGEHLNTIQIFDESDPALAKGDGHMYCSDLSRSFYFQSSDFEGKGLAIHARHIGALSAFLGKCSGPVRIYRGANMTYACDEAGHILGWVHQIKTHDRWRYTSFAHDTHVLVAPKVTLLHVIAAAQMVPHVQDVRLIYTRHNHAAGGAHTLHILANVGRSNFESFPVTTVEKKDEPSLAENFDCRVNLAHFRSLIDGVKGNDVELRVVVLKKDETRPRGGVFLRTLDVFEMHGNGRLVSITRKPEPDGTPRETAYTCKVTRCMSSML